MSVDIELRKAAAYISAGRNEAAHKILSEYLKDFPDSDLAWLLLSYVLEDPRKQLASVTRALKINPQNAKAKDRLDQLMDLAADRTSEESTANGGVQQDWPSFYTHSKSEIDEWASRPLSIEERMAFVTLEAETARGYRPENYPAESFFTDRSFDQDKDLYSGKERRLRPKYLLAGGAALIIFTIAVILGIKFINGDFISKADAEATASVETAIALATQEAKGRLPPTWTPTITPTITHTPTPSATPTPTVTATMDMPNPTVSAEIEILQQQVSGLRELSAKETVNTYIIMRSKVRSLLENYYFSAENTQDEITDTEIVLAILGLIDPGYDLSTNLLNSLTGGIGGFYLHETNQIYVIGYRFSAIEKFIYSHEFGHALVDQNFDLGRLNLYPRCEGNEDRCKAIQALVEGDAMLLMSQWLTQVATAEEYDEILNYHPPRGVLTEQNPPPFAIRNSEFPYDEGLTFIDTLYTRGGWASINQSYSNLPLSTEQILHPEKYLSAEAPVSVPPVSLDSVLRDPWRLVRNNTLGEWLTYLILGFCTNPQASVGEILAVQASEGWGGDSYQVYHNLERDDTVLVAHWKWDGVEDRSEFDYAMRYYLENRFATGALEGTIGECWEGDQQVSCYYSADRQSMWIVAPTIELVQSLETLYPAFR